MKIAFHVAVGFAVAGPALAIPVPQSIAHTEGSVVGSLSSELFSSSRRDLQLSGNPSIPFQSEKTLFGEGAGLFGRTASPKALEGISSGEASVFAEGSELFSSSRRDLQLNGDPIPLQTSGKALFGEGASLVGRTTSLAPLKRVTGGNAEASVFGEGAATLSGGGFGRRQPQNEAGTGSTVAGGSPLSEESSALSSGEFGKREPDNQGRRSSGTAAGLQGIGSALNFDPDRLDGLYGRARRTLDQALASSETEDSIFGTGSELFSTGGFRREPS